MTDSSTPNSLRERVIESLRSVHDPELPVNIFDLGLIYQLDCDDDGRVSITMSLTTPNCPVAEMIPNQVQRAVKLVEGVQSVSVELSWEPPWTPDRMSDDAKLTLDMMGITWSTGRGPTKPNTTTLTVGKTGRPRRSRGEQR